MRTEDALLLIVNVTYLVYMLVLRRVGKFSGSVWLVFVPLLLQLLMLLLWIAYLSVVGWSW